MQKGSNLWLSFCLHTCNNLIDVEARDAQTTVRVVSAPESNEMMLRMVALDLKLNASQPKSKVSRQPSMAFIPQTQNQADAGISGSAQVTKNSIPRCALNWLLDWLSL